MKKAKFAKQLLVATSTVMALGVGSALAEEMPLKNRSIAYVLTNDHWATFATADGKLECPDGVNDGPREEYAKLFPNDGKVRRIQDTELKREAEIWFPALSSDDGIPFKESKSKVAKGLNLDGKIGPNDYESPEGEKGIDNQFNRALGCVDAYRPGNALYDLHNRYMQFFNWGRMLIEITNVDNLTNDDDVTVTLYKARDPMLTDGTGNEYLPYGTQRIDERWGKKFTSVSHGKIVNGVLTTDGADMRFTHNYYFDDFGIALIKGAKFKLNVLPDQANGIVAGYVDIESFIRMENGGLGSHSSSYGRQAMAANYRALYRVADGYPDANGKNTAVSGAKELTFKQVYIKRAEKRVAEAK